MAIDIYRNGKDSFTFERDQNGSYESERPCQ